MLGRLKFDLTELVNEMLDQLPEEVFESKVSTFLDPCMGGGQFVFGVETRLREYGHSDANIAKRVFGVESSLLRLNYAVNKYALIGQYFVCKDYTEYEETMKFDVVIGNPPYQDGGSRDGGQSKIYNQFSKKALSLVKDGGSVVFLTPTSVLKKSKRFSLIGQQGLKVVDFTANNHFDVGTKICGWFVDFSYNGKVKVISVAEQNYQLNTEAIYDYSEVDKEFIQLYTTLKNLTDKPDKRMFSENNFGTSSSKTMCQEFTYPLYKLTNNKLEIPNYSKRIPIFTGKKKMMISITQSLNEKAIIVDTRDYIHNYMFIDVKNKQEVNNIKSFIFSEYFQAHSNKWKKVDGYGFNYALKYLPPFNKTKHWTNTQVKKFIESFK